MKLKALSKGIAVSLGLLPFSLLAQEQLSDENQVEEEIEKIALLAFFGQNNARVARLFSFYVPDMGDKIWASRGNSPHKSQRNNILFGRTFFKKI